MRSRVANGRALGQVTLGQVALGLVGLGLVGIAADAIRAMAIRAMANRVMAITLGSASAVAVGLFSMVISPPPSAAQSTDNLNTEVAPSTFCDLEISLAEPALTESSGLAFSNRSPDLFWTHNDSGGQPRLFAFDNAGQKRGEVQLDGIGGATDWEDMASYVDGQTPRLVIADCGDNRGNRESILLHCIDEPDPNETRRVSSVQTLVVTYPDGPRDCEAIAVDPTRRQLILFTKSRLPISNVYVIPLPRPESDPRPKSDPGPNSDPAPNSDPGQSRHVARLIAQLPMPLITAADVDLRTGDLWVVNYFQGYRFVKANPQQSLEDQLADLPNAIELPRWKQIEAVAIDSQSRPWVTSEGSPTRMGRVCLK